MVDKTPTGGTQNTHTMNWVRVLHVSITCVNKYMCIRNELAAAMAAGVESHLTFLAEVSITALAACVLHSDSAS